MHVPSPWSLLKKKTFGISSQCRLGEKWSTSCLEGDPWLCAFPVGLLPDVQELDAVASTGVSIVLQQLDLAVS